MAQIIVGLDIGASAIKMTRLQATPFRFELLDFSEHSLPAHVDLPWEQLVTNVLQVLFSDREMKTDKIIASIPGRYVSTRILQLPFSDKKKIEQTLPFEIEGLIPLPLEEILLDYQILETSLEGTWILVLSTEKQFIESQLELLHEAGIDPHVIIPPSIALSNVWKELSADGEDETPYAIMDFGEKETSFCIMQGRTIRYCRTWALGASSLTEALKDNLELAPAQAQDKKEKEADLYPPPSPGGDSEKEWIADILSKALKPIVRNLRQSLMSIAKTYDLTVQKIYICGQGSHLKGLDKLLSEDLQAEIIPLALKGPAGDLFNPTDYRHSTMATSLGLAYHGVREMAASKLNLRTGEYVYVSEREELKKQLFTVGIMASVLILMLLIFGGSKYHLKNQEYRQQNALINTIGLEIYPDLKNLPPGLQRNSAITSRLEQEKRQQELFSPLSPDSLSVLDILLAVTKAVPENIQIDVKEILMDSDKVRIEGETESYATAEQIKQNLLSSDIFHNVDIPEIKNNLDQTKVKFKMLLQLNQKII